MNTKEVLPLEAIPLSAATLASLLVASGILAFGAPLFAPGKIAGPLSWLLMLSGVTQLLYSSSISGDDGEARQTVFVAGLYLGAGFWLKTTPLNTVATLVLLLSLFFCAGSLIDICMYFLSPRDHRSPWILLTALATLLLIAVTWKALPRSTSWALAIVAGESMSLMGTGRLFSALSPFPRTQHFHDR